MIRTNSGDYEVLYCKYSSYRDHIDMSLLSLMCIAHIRLRERRHVQTADDAVVAARHAVGNAYVSADVHIAGRVAGERGRHRCECGVPQQRSGADGQRRRLGQGETVRVSDDSAKGMWGMIDPRLFTRPPVFYNREWVSFLANCSHCRIRTADTAVT